MDREVEVVEEEAVVDDLHDEYYDNTVEYEEYVLEEDEIVQEERQVLLNTTIIKINPALIDEEKRKFRVPATEISDDLYAAFCKKVENFEHTLPSPEDNEKLDCIFHSGDWAIARHLPDEILGLIDPVMLHLPLSKFLLNSENRARLIKESMTKHQNMRNPIGVSLLQIQKTYIGMPPVIQLRNLLEAELRNIFPLVSATPSIQLTAVRKMAAGGKDSKGKRPKKDKMPMALLAGRAGKQGDPPSIEPICELIYERLAQVIAGVQRPEGCTWPLPIRALLAKGCLVAERIERNSVELDEMGRGGWIIRERSTGRIVPRKNDVERIWQRIHDRMADSNSMQQVIAYVDGKFVGITTDDQRRTARLEDLYKGSRVIFPPKQSLFGRIPMQYVQMEVVEPPFDEYHSEELEAALLIVDLHSQFAFVKPIIDVAASIHELVRHSYDTFATFGIPYGYFTTTSSKHSFYIHQAMDEIERHFKVTFKSTEWTKEHPCAKVISSEALKRSAGESGFRWMDTLHLAVVEWNRRPNYVFGNQLSPFEVMFGRSPWKAEEHDETPSWIDDPSQEEKNLNEDWMHLPLKDRLQKWIESLLPPTPTVSEGKVIDPGTSIRYEIGDKVYIRNPNYTVDSPVTGVKRRNKEYPNRYIRGTIAEEDDSHPELFYRVVYNGAMDDGGPQIGDLWPGQQNDDSEELDSTWISPWDLAPSSFELQCRRTLEIPSTQSKLRCECELEYCDLEVDEECTRGRSTLCCHRHDDGPCDSHGTFKKRRGRRRKRKMGEDYEEEETNDESERAHEERPIGQSARYMYKNGSLVRIKPKMKREESDGLPDNILQDFSTEDSRRP